ncbi:hypothetical protein M0R45_031464 [Rubus argutus]|uniref:NADH dehydrogenase subunit 6 n=1 Tax=Rubus argutus TaxID=59490 RepID=A0AAW1WGI5_RUBAR
MQRLTWFRPYVAWWCFGGLNVMLRSKEAAAALAVAERLMAVWALDRGGLNGIDYAGGGELMCGPWWFEIGCRMGFVLLVAGWVMDEEVVVNLRWLQIWKGTVEVGMMMMIVGFVFVDLFDVMEARPW